MNFTEIKSPCAESIHRRLTRMGDMEVRRGDYAAGGAADGGYQPFLENTAGIVRIKMYRFSRSDLFWM